jgi:hypothetical protein
MAPRTGSRAVGPSASAVSTAHPDHVIGHGTRASCTSQAVVRAVAAGGVITFSCGPRPVTIVMKATAKVRNTSARVVLDGGGMVTLSGGGVRRILYMDTCDPAQTWTTSHCQDQSSPVLVVQNMTFADGYTVTIDGTVITGNSAREGGGAVFFVSNDRTGTLRIEHSRLRGNPNAGFQTAGYPGVFFLGRGTPLLIASTLS